MSEPYRPSPEQRRLFGGLAKEIRDHGPEYLSAATWFGREFSLKAIDSRKKAELTPEDKQFLKDRKREGFVPHKRRDPSGYMERLLRATENLIEIDDSALPKAARLEHYRRVILVGTLMTDPDLHEEAPDLAKALAMDRSHWPTAESLTVGGDREIELNRWWARDQVFDPDFRHYVPFQALSERALVAVQAVRPAETRPFTPSAEPSKPVQAATANPNSAPAPVVFDIAALSVSDRGVLVALDFAASRRPPRALSGGEIKTFAEQRKYANFRDADHARRTVYSLQKRGWPIENAHNGTGYRLMKSLKELCPPLAKWPKMDPPIGNQSGTN